MIQEPNTPLHENAEYERLVTQADERLMMRHLGEGEELLGVIHQHWLALAKEVLLPLVAGVILPLLALPLFRDSTALFIILLILLLGAGYVVFLFLDWFNDAILLTNENVMLILWKNPFNVKTQRIEYPRLESVEVQRKGILSFIFKVGRLEMVTPNGIHVLPLVHEPEKKQQWILDRKHEMMEGGAQGAPDVETLRQALEALLASRGASTAPGHQPPDNVDPDAHDSVPKRRLRLTDLSPPDA